MNQNYLDLPAHEFYGLYDDMALRDTVKADEMFRNYRIHRDAMKQQQRAIPSYVTNTELFQTLMEDKSKELMKINKDIEALQLKMKIETDRISMTDTSGDEASLAVWEEKVRVHDIEAIEKVATQEQLLDKINENSNEEKDRIHEMYRHKEQRERDEFERRMEDLRQKKQEKLDRIDTVVEGKRKNLTVQIEQVRMNLNRTRQYYQGMAEGAQQRIERAVEQASPALIRMKAELGQLLDVKNRLRDEVNE